MSSDCCCRRVACSRGIRRVCFGFCSLFVFSVLLFRLGGGGSLCCCCSFCFVCLQEDEAGGGLIRILVVMNLPSIWIF